MKKYLIAGVLVAAFVTPAFAEEFYVVFDPASHKCEAMHNIPSGMKSLRGQLLIAASSYCGGVY
jgi:hypothetical protein